MRKTPLVLLEGEELYSELLQKAQQLWTDIPMGMANSDTVQWNVPLMLEQGKYATGTQEQIRYKLDPSVQADAGSNPALIYTSATRNVQFASKLLASAIGIMEKQVYEPQVNRIDRSSKRFREEYRKDLEFAILLNQMNVAYSEMAQELQIDPSVLPDRTDELDLYMYSDTALEEEIQMEYALTQSDEFYNMISLVRQIRLHLMVHGVAGLRIDNSGPKLVVRTIAPLRSRTAYSEKEDLSDISYFREQLFFPLIYLKTYYADTFTLAQWQEIEAIAMPYDQMMGYGNGLMTAYGGFEGDQFVQVLDAVWKEGVRYNLKVKAAKAGLRTFHDINGTKGTYGSEPMECVMGLKWIVGTNILFDYGRQIPEMRCPKPTDPMDASEHDWRPVQLPVILYRPMPLYGISVTMLDKIIPVIDELQNLTNKYNNLVKNIKPGITAINVGKLADLMSDPGIRDPQVVKRILLNYLQKGDIYYNDKDDAPGKNSKPVESFADGTAVQLEMLWQQILNQMNLAREYTGLPLIAEGQVAERQGKGTTQMALNQVETGLSLYSLATKDIYERTHKQLCLLYQYTGKSGMHKNKPFKIDPTQAREWIFNITCKMVATDEDWALLKEAAYQAWANGEGWLGYQDLIYITTNPSLKEAQKRFGYLDKLNKKQAQQAQGQMEQANAQVAAQNTEQKLAEIEAKGRAELEKQAEIGQQKMEQLVLQLTEQAKTDRAEMANDIALKIMEVQSAQKIAEMKPEPVASD